MYRLLLALVFVLPSQTLLIAQPSTEAYDALSAAFSKGHALWQEGHIEQAVPYFEKAIRLAPGVCGADHVTTADLHNRLGLLYYETSRFALAESQFRHAVRIREVKLGKDHPLTGESLNNLAIQLKEQGRYDQAEAPLRRALLIQQKTAPEEPIVANFLDNLGFLCQQLNRHDEASELFGKALTIRRATRGENHPETAQSLRNLADQLRRAGKLDESSKYYRQSLQIFEEKLGPKHRKIAISLHSLALLELEQGRPAEALPLLERCLRMQQALSRGDDPEVSVGLVLDNLALVHGCCGDWKKAAQAMEGAQDVYLRLVNESLPAQPEAEQLTFLKTGFEPTLHRGLSLGLAAKENPAICAQSAMWLIKGKGVAHQVLAERALLVRDRQNPAIAVLADKLATVREERARLAYLARDRQRADNLAHKQLELAGQEQNLVKEIGERRGRVGQASAVTLEQVRAALPADTVLIEVARFGRVKFQAGPDAAVEEYYAAWVIPPADKGSVQIVDLGPAEPIDAAAAAVRRGLQTGPDKVRVLGEKKTENELLGPLERLSRLLIHPLLPYTSTARRWVISPDGDLWLLPWAALRLPKGSYVVEHHEVRYVISGRDLVVKTKMIPSTAPLVMADPDFNLDLRDKPVGALPPLVANWQRLAGTAAEAKAVTPPLQKLAGVEPRLLIGAAAREKMFKTSPNPRVLVMSTHGFFLEDQQIPNEAGSRGGLRGAEREGDDTPRRRALIAGPLENPLLRCGLILAGANRRTSDTASEDGVLTGLEIVSTDLRGTELVVLSACETGIGQVHRGEGVAGLRQAFQLAGAKAVAATLWQVADRETADLVSSMFDSLANGQEPARALRSAQLAMIEQRRKQHGAAHPYFWAAFTLTGR